MQHPSSQIRTAALGLLLCALLGACARDAEDWKAAAAADTPEAYEAFLQRHPQSGQAAEALRRSKELAEKPAWDLATQSDTAESYRRFLAQHPDGNWAQEARVRIANFELAEAPSEPPSAAVAGSAAPVAAAPPAVMAPPPVIVAPAPVTVAAPPRPPAGAAAQGPAKALAPAPAKAPAQAAVAAAPPAAVGPAPAPATSSGVTRPAAASTSRPAGGGARVQLGAFGALENAQVEWRRLSGRFKVLGALQPDYVQAEIGGRRVFRLQADVESAAAADALCETLKASRQGCIRVLVR